MIAGDAVAVPWSGDALPAVAPGARGPRGVPDPAATLAAYRAWASPRRRPGAGTRGRRRRGRRSGASTARSSGSRCRASRAARATSSCCSPERSGSPSRARLAAPAGRPARPVARRRQARFRLRRPDRARASRERSRRCGGAADRGARPRAAELGAARGRRGGRADHGRFGRRSRRRRRGARAARRWACGRRPRRPSRRRRRRRLSGERDALHSAVQATLSAPTRQPPRLTPPHSAAFRPSGGGRICGASPRTPNGQRWISGESWI